MTEHSTMLISLGEQCFGQEDGPQALAPDEAVQPCSVVKPDLSSLTEEEPEQLQQISPKIEGSPDGGPNPNQLSCPIS